MTTMENTLLYSIVLFYNGYRGTDFQKTPYFHFIMLIMDIVLKTLPYINIFDLMI